MYLDRYFTIYGTVSKPIEVRKSINIFHRLKVRQIEKNIDITCPTHYPDSVRAFEIQKLKKQYSSTQTPLFLKFKIVRVRF